MRTLLQLLLIVILGVPAGAWPGTSLESALQRAGSNRGELERALRGVPDDQRAGLQWLIERMPHQDLATLSGDFLVEHCTGAYRAWRESPWRASVPQDVFLDALLPYACVNERRDAWRSDFRTRFAPLVKDARTPGEAAVRLNQQIFAANQVAYSTKRKKADQSPYETLESGLASCTGLSILLISACRSVGVPARFVGTPLWSDGSGNHSWVEVWDGEWKFTGAAEPTGAALNQGWFVDRAAGAKSGDPRHAIFAATWRESGLHFPLVWLPEDRSVRALDVSERYLKKSATIPEGLARVRFRVRVGELRFSAAVQVIDPSGTVAFEGFSKDERFDGNDHLTALLPLRSRYEVRVEGADPVSIAVERDEQLVELELALLLALRGAVEQGGLEALLRSELGRSPLGKGDAQSLAQLLVEQQGKRLTAERKAEHEARLLEWGGVRMPFWSQRFPDAPPGRRSLWISMHGGGGAPAAVNDQQWENQKRLYTLKEGVYVAPRAPTDTWNLWHQGHIDPLFSRLIENMILFEGVDPDRVYILGYSAGGDGVYQLAPRMADQLAAAGMMAGHPNETQPDGLRNIGFALHMGADDSAYNRNQIAAQWKERLAKLAAEDKGGYAHQVVIHTGKGHWMDREDRAALPWMARFTRVPDPEKLIWLQDDVVHRRYYWLAVDEPKAGTRITAVVEGQNIRIEGAKEAGVLRVRLRDGLVDLDRPVAVYRDGLKVHSGKLSRTAEVMSRCLLERYDPQAVYTAEIVTGAP